MPPPCSCTASSFTGFQISTPQEVKHILFITVYCFKENTITSSMAQRKEFGDSHIRVQGVNKSGVWLEPCLSFSNSHKHAQTDRGCLHKQNWRNELPSSKWNHGNTHMRIFVCTRKLLFSLILLKQQKGFHHIVELKSLSHSSSLSHFSCEQNKPGSISWIF